MYRYIQISGVGLGTTEKDVQALKSHRVSQLLAAILVTSEREGLDGLIHLAEDASVEVVADAIEEFNRRYTPLNWMEAYRTDDLPEGGAGIAFRGV